MRSQLALLFAITVATAGAAPPSAELVIAVGAPGDDKYRATFGEAAEAWKTAGEEGGCEVTTIGLGETGSGDHNALQEAVTASAGTAQTPLWIVLIGHGTHDGRDSKFNLRGEDITARDLAAWLEAVKRPVALINTTASSAPFIKVLSGENRVVITATKSGFEDSFARFGQFLAAAVNAPDGDIDGDGATSLLEAFLKTSEDVAEFYEKEGRIATEHALIDDNGDGLGTPASWFRGARAIKTAKDGSSPDGSRAHQFHLVPSEEERQIGVEIRATRDALESELFALRAKKDKMEEDTYFAELERLARALAELYRSSEQPIPEGDAPTSGDSP